MLPAPLAAVALATAATAAFDLPVARVEVQGLLEAVQPPGAGDFGGAAPVGVLGTVLAFTLIASAESLFSAAAVDRLHDGSAYRLRQGADGAGRGQRGVRCARRAADDRGDRAQLGERGRRARRTKLSRVLHGVWLLLFAAALPAALGMIPVAALAGVLVHAGWKLIPVRQLVPLWREHRAEAVVLAVTAIAIVGDQHVRGRADRAAAGGGEVGLGDLARAGRDRGRGRRSCRCAYG